MPPNRRPAPPRRNPGPASPALPLPLPLPHERDETTPATASAPDAVIAQAKRDLDAGQVDTDMHATAGLDADLRARMVPGAGGKPPGAGA